MVRRFYAPHSSSTEEVLQCILGSGASKINFGYYLQIRKTKN